MPTPHKKPFRVGLTGGIASGKTMISNYFAELGVPVIDTDLIAREVVMPGSAALDEISEQFGPAVIAGDGSLDRQAMRKLVFSSDEKRKALESILHPRIRDETYRQAAEAEAPYVIIVVPLLFESPMKEAMDRVLVVDCSVETQLNRLLARDKESEDQARRIIATQSSREERLSIADDIVSNDGDKDDSMKAVLELHEAYLQLANENS
ncbi:MAG: dephospho-CoA kinase [Gammaproteobacteria bacterium]|nr:dephospho-CoA kinase [Gammaproteobacteria bacterium]